jgi:hypothetical protein
VTADGQECDACDDDAQRFCAVLEAEPPNMQ